MMRLLVVFVALLLTLFSAYSSANETHYVELDPSAGGATITIRMEDYYASSAADTFELASLPEGGSLYQTDLLGQKSGPAISVTDIPVTINGLGGSLVFEPSTAVYPLMASFLVNAKKLPDTEVSSDTIKILLHHCAVSIPDLDPWGGNVSPPAPTSATIVYNPDTQRFDVVVDTAYLRDDAVYVIDFANFDPNADDIRVVTTCTNRVALAVTDADFDTLFLSAPDATFTSALDGSEFLAYPSTGSLWDVTATDCGRLQYKASLTFSQLQACQMRRSSSPSIDVVDGSTEISYSGTLYVNVIEPLDSSNANAGYEKTQFAYPFAFTYSKTIDTLSSVTSDNDFSVAVNSVTLDSSTGNLAMVIITTYDGTSLNFDAVVPESNGATLTVTRSGPTCSSSPCIEKWNVASTNAWILSNNGDYTFKFTESASSTTVWGIITIRQSLNAAQQGSFTFANALAFYANQPDFLQGASALVDGDARTYGSNGEVFVREEVTVADGDRSKFTLTIVNAWVCYTTISNFVIKSCTDPFLTDKERFQLVISGEVNPTFNRFDTVISNWPDTSFTDTTKLAAGISFQALPLAFQSEDYTVHLQVRIADAPSNRRRQVRVLDRVARSTLGNVGNFTGAFAITVDSSDSGALTSAASILVITAAMILALF